MEKPPYDQRIARVLVGPLARTPVSPNHLTALSLALALDRKSTRLNSSH